MSGDLVEAKAGGTLASLVPIFLENARKAGKPFDENEYVLAANLITLLAEQPEEAVRIHKTSGSICEARPSFHGIWFAWGNDSCLRSFRKNILDWYHGIKPHQPPHACFVTWQENVKAQAGKLGAPALDDNVKHPKRLEPTAIGQVLWQIL